MRHLYLLILVCTPGVLSAQNEFQDRTVEALDLSVSLTEDEAVVADDSFEWGDLSEKPNLNDMDLSMLRAAKLSDFQIFNLHSFIKRNGQLLSFYVLYEIKGWDATAIASVSQIFDLRPKRDVDWDFKTLWARSYHTIATRVATTLPVSRGYKNGDFLGNNLFTRLSYQGKSSDQLSISLGMEKDAGEPKYWDFVSGSLEVQKLDYLEKVILGDYYVNLGQGVALWNSFSFGKGGVQSTRIAREGRGILAKKTPSESPFFRGIAAYFTKKKLDLYVFLSRKNMSATRDTLLGGGSIFRNLSSSYLYRTASELERKGNLPRTDLGVAVQWNETYYRLGALHYQTHFKHSLNPELSQATTNSFTGSALRVSSIYYRALVANTFHLFGEMATQGKNISFLQGVSLESGDHEFSLLYRRYPTQGRYFDSNAFSEQRSVAEQGVYLSFLWYLPYDITCEMYTDLYEVLDFSHPNIFPYQGKDFWLKVSHQPLQHFLYFMQLQYERRLLQRFSVMDDLQNLLRLRFQTAWVRESFTLKWRFDYSDLVGLDQKPATAFTQDVRYTTDESLSYKFRIAIFDVSHWPLRIYSLSPAVSRSFYGVVFYRSGTHFSGVVSYKPYPGLKLETHLSLFDYWGERTISQGNNEILGSQRFYLSLQATLKI